MHIKFVDYDLTYCDLSWNWLNDDEIKKLTMTPEFTKENQNEWFYSIKHKDDYLIWGIEFDNKPIGALGIKNIDYINKSGEYFGYIGEKEYWGKCIGKIMMKYVIKKASEKEISKIYLKVEKFNERATKLYIKSGFQVFEDDGECLNMIWQEGVINV
ncbi:MAG TPA: GNAT family N-acetyltransferase [Candidatus Paceibacterota bacterium]